MNPQALNRYSYVLDNPLKYTDPTGYVNWKLVGVGVTLGVIAVAFTIVVAPVAVTALTAEVGLMAIWGAGDLALLGLAPALLGGTGGVLIAAGIIDQNAEIEPEASIDEPAKPQKQNSPVQKPDLPVEKDESGGQPEQQKPRPPITPAPTPIKIIPVPDPVNPEERLAEEAELAAEGWSPDEIFDWFN
jgi:hypothetical protein